MATINNERLTLEDFHKYLEAKPTVRVMVQGQSVDLPVAEPLAFQALQDLVAQRVTLQLAKDEGLAPSKEDIEKELDIRKKLRPTFVQDLTGRGLTLQRIRESLELDLARERLLTKGITVTDQEVEDYIKQNPKQFEDPERVAMHWVFVKSEARKTEVEKEIKMGQSAPAIAARFSEADNARQTQGRFPQDVKAALPAELQQIVDKTQEGRWTDWVQLQDGWARFHVTKKTPAKAIVMDDTKKQMLKRQLAMDRGRQASDLGKRVLEKLKASDIEVRDPALKEMWAKAFESLKNEGKIDTSSPTSDATAAR
jgi:ribosomal protein L9